MQNGFLPRRKTASATSPKDNEPISAGACEKPIKSYVARIEVFADGRRVESPVDAIADVCDGRSLEVDADEALDIERRAISDEVRVLMAALEGERVSVKIHKALCGAVLTLCTSPDEMVASGDLGEHTGIASWDIRRWLRLAHETGFLKRPEENATRPFYCLSDAYLLRLKNKLRICTNLSE